VDLAVDWNRYRNESRLDHTSGRGKIRLDWETIANLSGDLQLSRNLRVLGGVSNLADKSYYNRVFQNGIEPGRSRTVYAGVALGL